MLQSAHFKSDHLDWILNQGGAVVAMHAEPHSSSSCPALGRDYYDVATMRYRTLHLDLNDLLLLLPCWTKPFPELCPSYGPWQYVLLLR